MLFALPIISYASQAAAVVIFAVVYRKLSNDMKILGLFFVLSLVVSTLQIILALKWCFLPWTGAEYLRFPRVKG